MRNLRCRRLALVATTSMGLVTLAIIGRAQAQGLFDFLFKPPPDTTARAYAPSSPEFGAPKEAPPRARAPRISGTGGHVSYCVRLCDGRYFPIQRSEAQAGELCSLLCPSSKTRIFSGTEIAHAAAGDGTSYTSLENAFLYREKVVEGCTCNGTDAFGLAKIDVADDPTLRKGDLIATEDGLEKSKGPTREFAKAKVSRRSARPQHSAGIRGGADAVKPAPEQRAVPSATTSSASVNAVW
jgi:hypothetical protein